MVFCFAFTNLFLAIGSNKDELMGRQIFLLMILWFNSINVRVLLFCVCFFFHSFCKCFAFNDFSSSSLFLHISSVILFLFVAFVLFVFLFKIRLKRCDGRYATSNRKKKLYIYVCVLDVNAKIELNIKKISFLCNFTFLCSWFTSFGTGYLWFRTFTV